MPIKHAIITGASKGIGLCLAKQLVHSGTVVSNLSRNSGGVGDHFLSDMAKQPLTGYAQAIAQNGPPDLLVLNAGITKPGHLRDTDQDTFRSQMEVNFFAVVELTRAAIKQMQPGGHIVFVASGAALFGIQGHSAYCASKFAVRGFAEAMRAEVIPLGLFVSIVYPPNTDTTMFAKELVELSHETKAITTSAKTYSPEFVARKILQGVARKRFEIPVGPQMGLLNRLHSPFKAVIFAFVDRVANRARKAH